MNERIIVVGAGINGLVAANYLQRNGNKVTLLERKANVGGACIYETFTKNNKNYLYPSAATVFGFMQDFVFEETGLSRRVTARAPQHPTVVWSEPLQNICFFYDDMEKLRRELRQKWNEQGDVDGYYRDLEKVRQFLLNGYRHSQVPNIESAYKALGAEISELWISGTARNLMNHYFSSEAMKVYASIDVTESGPVSLDSQYSAFTIPLMASGSVFGGSWGFVKGGLPKIVEELGKINEELGVQIITSAEVLHSDSAAQTISYRHMGSEHSINYDKLVFASDPKTAANIINDSPLVDTVDEKRMLGTSGKLIMLFDKAIKWHDDSKEPDFDPCFKFIINAASMDEIEASNKAVIECRTDFSPAYLELYCEGAGMRSLGDQREYDALTVFIKNLAFDKKGEDLPQVKDAIEKIVLPKIINKEDHAHSILLTPKDLSEKFFFPQGNIDHVELSNGQTYFARSYSPSPQQNFYQFGSNEKIFYCGAGSYPCGSVAGTTGYMCASQMAKIPCFSQSAD